MRGAEEEEEKHGESDDLEDKDRCHITQELPFEHGRTKAQSAFVKVDGDQFPAGYCIAQPAAHCLRQNATGGFEPERRVTRSERRRT